MQVLVFAALLIVSYLIGCFSTARLFAKSFRSLNIYKVGTGHPDTQNIFCNISKPLGILSGIVDFSKMFILLYLLYYLLTKFYPCIATQTHLLILGFLMVIGHSFPLTNKFKGGRGIFTYLGYITFFFYFYTIWPMIGVAVLALLVIVFFKQIRFAQYMIVLLPPFISFFLKGIPNEPHFPAKMFISAILMGIINFFVSKRLGEI